MFRLKLSDQISMIVISLLSINAIALANKDTAAQESETKFKYVWNGTEQERDERLKWWTDARFGMFIHSRLTVKCHKQ